MWCRIFFYPEHFPVSLVFYRSKPCPILSTLEDGTDYRCAKAYDSTSLQTENFFVSMGNMRKAFFYRHNILCFTSEIPIICNRNNTKICYTIFESAYITVREHFRIIRSDTRLDMLNINSLYRYAMHSNSRINNIFRVNKLEFNKVNMFVKEKFWQYGVNVANEWFVVCQNVMRKINS